MSQKIKNIFFSSLPAIILSSLLAVAVIYAFTEPTQAPPQGSVPIPINVSGVTQTFADSKTLKVKNDGTGILSIEGGIWGKGIGIFDGNVGIGTTAPEYNLDVAGGKIRSGSSAVDSFVYVGDANLIKFAGSDFYINSSANKTLYLNSYSGTAAPIVIGGYIGQNSTSFTTSPTGNSYINSAGGNVGIGTTAPGEKLTVNGKVSANDYYIGVINKWASQLGGQYNCECRIYYGRDSWDYYETEINCGSGWETASRINFAKYVSPGFGGDNKFTVYFACRR